MFPLQLAAQGRVVVRPDGERVVQQRDVGQIQRPVLQALERAEPLEDGSEDPVLAPGQRPDPA
jgi:hypothetical protein